MLIVKPVVVTNINMTRMILTIFFSINSLIKANIVIIGQIVKIDNVFNNKLNNNKISIKGLFYK